MRTRPSARLAFASASASSTGWICRSCRAHEALVAEYLPPVPSLVKTRKSSTTTKSTSLRRGKLPDTPARTRFAPSPTGNLHLGSIRTALFNYLLARATKGQFLLRIEDTDAKRTVPGAEERLYEDLTWAGLHWDEGPIVGGPYGPYRQSERIPTYKKHIEKLLTSGRAYRCFCSSERIDELNRRRHDKGLKLGYDRKCTHLSTAEAEERASRGDQHVIRFRSPETWPRYNDLVYGRSGHGAEKTKKLLADEPVYEDTILIKSDGFPTYHWANVCDDHEMHITHVVRGSEWMASTPLHVALYESLGWTVPLFAHVPLLVDQNRQKLSKRNFDSDISGFRAKGIFPDALVNFAALLGWSHTQKNDVLDLPQLERLFDLKITKGNTIVSFDKLQYLQIKHARRRVEAGGEPFEQMIRDVAVAVLHRYGAARVMQVLAKRPLRDVLATILRVGSLPYRSAVDFAEQCSIFFEPASPPTVEQLEHAAIDPAHLHYLRVAASTLCLVPESDWTEAVHHSQLRMLEQVPDESVQDAAKWKRDLYHYLRWALIGGESGPGVAVTLEILGRDASIDKIQAANRMSQEYEMDKTKPVIEAQAFKGTVDGKRRLDKEWKGYTF
ncbi:glutamyl-tRNA synthetase [Capronia coronata CBS 617.96]|uniref:Glutamate--tRNA ligase, mitochondrial n=1 Tax=Capronia coronata CBS 617.96 TaxID=1182541 RepID=W9XUP0_9EURO|nr:glutamyl-tRNA synthetase [Capronia coronata CBS 617.96]EXJ83928.1 glutamyl-tRNA synthetase [Capronia coronata CBS 617.96]